MTPATLIRFGTDGWRALIADEFTTANVARVAQAHAQYLLSLGTSSVVIGYDTRFAGRLFAETAAKVMAANGLEVHLTRTFVPTPVLSHAVKHLGAGGGVMLTASHNPAGYNGYKIKGAYGGSATPAIVQQIETQLEQLRPIPSFDPSQHCIHDLEPRDAYFASIAALLDLETLRGFTDTLVHDAMGGAGAGYLEQFARYAQLPLKVINLRGVPDPLFYGVNPEPVLQNLEPLVSLMRDRDAMTVATITDGDADRVGAMLSGGAIFNSHQIFCVLLDHLYRKGLRGNVVKTFSTTQMIDALARNRNLELLETPIGFKYITDAMLTGDVLIGGEESGGIGVKGHLPERDGILNSLLLLEAVASSGKPLGELFHQLELETNISHAYDRIDLQLEQPITTADLRTRLEGITELAGQHVQNVSDKDGIKLTLEGNAWVLFRASGTEPVLRLYCEAPDMVFVKQSLVAAQALFTNRSVNNA